MLQNASVTVFAVSKLLNKNQHRRWGDGGGGGRGGGENSPSPRLGLKNELHAGEYEGK